MAVVVTPLLSGADTLLDRLWRARMVKEPVLLLPDWMDCAFPDLTGVASGDEALLRQRLLLVGAQLGAIGIATVARAVFGRGGAADRQAQLLALAGSAAWHGEAAFANRRGADGAFYELRTAVAGAALHAQHAALALSQTLRVEAVGSRGELCLPVGARCLSVACALRDIMVRLLDAGEAQLACQVGRLSQLPQALLPPALAGLDEAACIRLAG